MSAHDLDRQNAAARAASRRLGKPAWLLLICLAATAIWIPQRQELSHARQGLADVKAQRAQFEARIALATAALDKEGLTGSVSTKSPGKGIFRRMNAPQ